MDIRARYNDLTSVSVLLGAATFLVADESHVLLAIAAGAILIAWIGSRGRRAERPWSLPHSAINLLVIAAICSAAFKAFVAGDGNYVSVLGQFFVLITIIKLFDRRTPRDDAQVVGLSVCTAVSAVLTGASLKMALLLAAYVPVVIAAAMMWQINEGLLRAQAAASAASDGLLRSNAPASLSARLPLHFTGAIVFVLLICLPIAVGVFILAPRGLQVGRSARFGLWSGTTSGFTNEVQLGRAGLLSENTTPVLDVQFTDGAGANLGSADRTFYLRAATRDSYDRETGNWRSSSTREPPPDRTISGSSPSRYQGDSTVVFQNVRVRATYTGTHYAFAVWRPLAIAPPSDVAARVSADDSTILLSSSARSAGRADPLAMGCEYTIVSRDLDLKSSQPIKGPLEFQTGRIHDLAASILRKADITPTALASPEPPTRKAVSVLCDYLRHGFQYTVEMIPPPPGEDPIEFFLFDRKQGHCEYFASALVCLCQSVGIHARLVVGYVATDFNDYAGRYVVRESNAHAWTEAEVGSGRWATFDPTPPADLDRIHRPGRGAFARVKGWWDALELSWSAGIISFDQRAQSHILGGERSEAGDPDRFAPRDSWITRWLRHRSRVGDWWKWALQLGVPGVLVIGAIVVAARELTRRWRLARVLHLGRNADPELRRLLSDAGFYADSLDALERAGLPKPDSRPPLAHAGDIATAHPGQADTFRKIAALYYRVRFGRQALAPDELSAAALLVGQLRSARRER